MSQSYFSFHHFLWCPQVTPYSHYIPTIASCNKSKQNSVTERKILIQNSFRNTILQLPPQCTYYSWRNLPLQSFCSWDFHSSPTDRHRTSETIALPNAIASAGSEKQENRTWFHTTHHITLLLSFPSSSLTLPSNNTSLTCSSAQLQARKPKKFNLMPVVSQYDAQSSHSLCRSRHLISSKAFNQQSLSFSPLKV